MSVFRRPHDYRAVPSKLFLLLAVASATSGSAAVQFANAGTLGGVGALAGTASIGFTNSASSVTGGDLSGSAALAFSTGGVLDGSGALVGSSALVFDGTATGVVTSVFNPVIFHPRKHRVAIRRAPDYAQYQRVIIHPHTISTDVTGIASVAFTPTATLSGIAATSASGAIAFGGQGLLRGTGALATSTPITITPTGTLTSGASGSVTGNAALVIDGLATLSGTGALLGTAPITFTAVATPAQTTSVTGVAGMVLDATGTLSDGSIPIVDTRQEFSVSVEVEFFDVE